MIFVENLSLAPGGDVLLEDAFWQINPGERIGLIGRNGTGKSTLLRTIVGEILPYNGSIRHSPKLQLGHLPQRAVSGSNKTLWNEARDAMRRLKVAEAALNIAQKSAESGEPGSEERLSEAMDSYEIAGGYRIDETIGETLHGLGFQPDDWQKPCSNFSGGWQMRIALAKLLLAQPDVSILDEPTNHLDIHARAWLADHLARSKNTVVVVSHDRYFLNKVCMKIVEIRDRKLRIFKGNYQSFTQNRALQIQQDQQQYERNRSERKKLQAFVDRFGAKATKAKQAQSRKKMLEKLPEFERPETLKSAPKISIKAGEASSFVAIELKGASVGWSPKTPLVKSINLHLERGMRLALVGANGSGKSTLLKTISGEICTLSGRIIRGENLRLGVFSQDIAQQLPPDLTPVEHICQRQADKGPETVRRMLGSMGLASETHTRKLSQLSGGEKARVALAMLGLGEHNTLLLDEPTNHLDVETAEALSEALRAFEGAVLIISHDRGLLENCATHLGRIEDDRLIVQQGVDPDLLVPLSMRNVLKKKQTAGAINHAENKKRANRKKKLQRELEKTEASIEGLEKKLAEMDEKLTEAGDQFDLIRKLSEERDSISLEIETAMLRWEELEENIAELS